MLGGNKNLKDSSAGGLDIPITDKAVSVSFTKINKLVTALYMVTDIIEKEEPLRNKLRTVGTEIISDMHSAPEDACSKIAQVMSFLDIASAINIISEMNCNILKKEFSQLDHSIRGATGRVKVGNGQVNLSGFFAIETPLRQTLKKDKYKSIGHQSPSGLGVQKGSTLMQALSDKKYLLSGDSASENNNNFLTLKKERHTKIIDVIKSYTEGATIKDIKTKMDAQTNGASDFSEKTLQRELVSMIQDNVLYKTGEKRWSRYFVKN